MGAELDQRPKCTPWSLTSSISWRSLGKLRGGTRLLRALYAPFVLQPLNDTLFQRLCAPSRPAQSYAGDSIITQSLELNNA